MTVFLATVNEVAWAGSAYQGSAPGNVTCSSFIVALHFSPPLSNKTTPVQIRAVGAASGCTASYPGITLLKKAHVAGGNMGLPFDPNTTTGFCGEPAVSNQADFNLGWKGAFNGTLEGGTFSGNAGFLLSTIGSPVTTTRYTDPAGHVAISLTASGSSGPDYTQGTNGSFFPPPNPPAGEPTEPGTASAPDLSTGKTPAQMATLCKNPKGIKVLKLAGSFSITGGPPA